MKQFTPFQKLSAGILLSLVLTVVSGGVFVWIYLQVRDSAERLTRIETEIAMLEEERRRARSADFISEEKKEEISRLDAFLIPGDKPIEFIEDLEKIARGTANKVTLDLVTEKAAGGAFSFRITAEGTEESVARHLLLIELLPHEISVEDLTFQKLRTAPGEEEKVRLVVVINVKTL